MRSQSIGLVLLVMGLAVGPLAAPKAPVVALNVEGIIDPVIAQYLVDGLKEAETMKAAAVLVNLNTPGGLLEATRDIVAAMINSPLPIIVYVTPRGSRATSAGVFIMMASDVAAMAPETHLGAAHPVTIGGDSPSRPPTSRERDNSSQPSPQDSPLADKPESTSVMEEKMVSDSAAYIRSLALERGRNAAWAERAVRESVSLTAQEALEQNVIEYVAGSQEELLQSLHGKQITKNKQKLSLDLAGAPIEEVNLSPIRRLLHFLAHPNVAYILMMLGIYGLIYEFASPGVGFGGVFGAICLLLAFFSLQVLPINTVGVVLIVLGLMFLVAEFFMASSGILSIGGVLALAIGSFMLIDVSRDLSVPRISLSLILPSALATGLFFGFVVKSVLSARRAKPQVGAESLEGARGVVREVPNPEGIVFLNGELWTANSNDLLQVGDAVVVVGHQGNTLIVKKASN